MRLLVFFLILGHPAAWAVCDYSMSGFITFKELNRVILGFQSGILQDVDSDSTATICLKQNSVVQPQQALDFIRFDHVSIGPWIKIKILGDKSGPALILDPFLNPTPQTPTAIFTTGAPAMGGGSVAGIVLENLVIVSSKARVNGVYVTNQDFDLINIHFSLSGPNAVGVLVSDGGSMTGVLQEVSGKFSGNNPTAVEIRCTSGSCGGVYSIRKSKFHIQDATETWAVSLKPALYFERTRFLTLDEVGVSAPNMILPALIRGNELFFSSMDRIVLDSPETAYGIHLTENHILNSISGDPGFTSKAKTLISISTTSLGALSRFKAETSVDGIVFEPMLAGTTQIQAIQEIELNITNSASPYGIRFPTQASGNVTKLKSVTITNSTHQAPCIDDPANWIQTSFNLVCQ